jgi:hypothetical protein
LNSNTATPNVTPGTQIGLEDFDFDLPSRLRRRLRTALRKLLRNPLFHGSRGPHPHHGLLRLLLSFLSGEPQQT